MQQWQIPTWQRASIPLLYINEELAAVVGFAIGDRYYMEGTANIYQVMVELNETMLSRPH